MTVEENWIDALEKMQVSKLVKNYIVSIDEELREYFNKTQKKIQERVGKEILGVQLVSSNNSIKLIMEQEIQGYIDNVITLIDYYVEGIYNCGKTFSQKKLKIEKTKPETGQRYYFNNNDKNFIDTYKTKKLEEINVFLDQSTLRHIQEYVRLKFNGEWILDDDKDFEKLKYTTQQLDEENINSVISIINSIINPIYEESLDFIVREIIVLYQVAQIQEYKNLGINTFSFFSDDDERCCSVCCVRSGKIFNIQDILDSGGDLIDGLKHAFCKYSIEPVINYRNQVTSIYFDSAFSIRADSIGYVDVNVGGLQSVKTKINFEINGIEFVNTPIEMEKRIQNLFSKLKIRFPQLIKKHKFIFIDDISNEKEWLSEVKNHYLEKGNNDFQAEMLALKDQDMLTNQIATFNSKDTIYISALSFDSQPIEHLILREMLRNEIVITNDLNNIYNEKQNSKKVAYGVAVYTKPFISFLAEENETEYLLESIIYYVNQPNKLKFVDQEIFKYIEKNINNIVGEQKK